MPPRAERARVEANLEALRTLRAVQDQERPATAPEREVLAQWSSWGAVPAVFDERDDRFAAQREQLSHLLDEQEWDAARRTTINAHYTNPTYVQAMWGGLGALGFTGGTVLEPGSGAGTFIGAAPDTARMVGVELDPVTASISAHLHPGATIRAESFADSPFPDGSFDAVIGNVPFADVTLRDPRHNQDGHSLHNHFILKSLALTRPGGMVAVLTSRYTMDSKNPAAREAMSQMGDLVTAVRLPSGAHQQYAGTEAITDLLVFFRRPEGVACSDTSWLGVQERTVPVENPATGLDPTGTISVNTWWNQHPDLVIGQEVLGHGMYGPGLIVRPNDRSQITEEVSVAIAAAMRHAADHEGWTFGAPNAGFQQLDPTQVTTPVARTGDVRQFAGHLRYDPATDRWSELADGVDQEITVPVAQQAQLRALLRLRDDVTTVLSLEAADAQDTAELAAARAGLNTHYDDYVDRYGPINTVTVTESTRNTADGPSTVTRRRYPPAVKTFSSDPHAPVVAALEVYDETTNTAVKAAVFQRRVVTPQIVRDHADTPADAVAIALDSVGEVRLPDVARLLGVEQDQARDALGTLVFDDPAEQGRLIPAAEYLSGNVRRALQVATEAATERPQLQVNVDALTAVLPTPLEPGDITVRLGAVWVPVTDVQDFMRETLGDASVQVEHAGGSTWKVSGARHTQAATSTWGTSRMDAVTIAERLMQQKRIVVTDTVENANGNDAQVVNPVETEGAKAKAEQLQERFGEWVWQASDRATRLADLYNEKFNSIALRSYTEQGQRLSLPGLAATFTPHPHQRAAVARMVAEPSVGLYHAVGAGKTAEMVMGATELRRLGLVNKPAIVVPNHMLEQFTREWLQLYPQAMILATNSEGLRGDKRRQFVARAATGDWDGVLLTQGAFQAIAVSQEAQKAYMATELRTLRSQLSTAREGGFSRSIKDIERRIIREEEKLGKVLDKPRDPGLTWEETGIDYLLVDELHLYKNLTIASNITGMGREGSQRATDLDMKLALMRERAGERGRVVTGATATPIANSMAEAYVMQRYLRPDLLADAGITDFDAWAATFGTTTAALEMAPQGGSFRVVERFARFQNLPEMLRMWHVSADVQTAEDLALPVPLLAARPDGQRAPETVAVAPSEAQRRFMADIGERAKAVKSGLVTPQEDNMLKISGDGRKAALDLRLMDGWDSEEALFQMNKLDVAATRIHRIWAQNRDQVLPSADGASTKQGALQIVFCDLGTPRPGWNAYDQLRDSLTGHGMDPARVAFVHDADTEAKKARLFAACRDGDVDVIIGSTAKMGVGTNIQTRAVALHHLDCPWRPADVEQREGRIIRQGNQNPEVQILRYVTEESFDAYSWQTVERKAKFIDQVMHGSLEQRDADDISSSATLSFNEIAALAAANPVLLEKAGAETDLAKLQRLDLSHQRDQEQRHRSIRQLENRQEYLSDLGPRVHAAIQARTPTTGDRFTATVAGQRFTDRVDAAEHLRGQVGPVLGRLDRHTRPEIRLDNLVHVGGHQVDAVVQYGRLGAGNLVSLRLHDLPQVRADVDAGEIHTGAGHGLTIRVENLPAQLDRVLASTAAELKQTRAELAAARDGLGAPFPQAAELVAARERVADLEAQLHRTSSDANIPSAPDVVADPAAPERDDTSISQQRQVNTEGMRRVREHIAQLREGHGGSSTHERHGHDHDQPTRSTHHGLN
ncbi:helicase-related protein [Allobranchiibius sp. CTAmp26]|uniref:helicase-related protein n=1 Tax=Allobranchiibius sp. CTAmp26 TaxID=2815214 RepID=UPI001AA13227|nr:helicase-related protein [Allobranchiibius sp. CTAmp26]MBO1756868.1 helicase [Allobranchiibius sp. CTAmp26]